MQTVDNSTITQQNQIEVKKGKKYVRMLELKYRHLIRDRERLLRIKAYITLITKILGQIK